MGENKILMKITHLPNIAIFASGAGSNAKKIIEASLNHQLFKVKLIVSNRINAGVLEFAAQYQIDTLIIEKNRFLNLDAYLPEILKHQIDFIVLAGFLWKIPTALINAFPNKIINIHPALLPKYGGKGMFGHHVHEAVIANKEKISGITIHYVDEIYDHGKIILQEHCSIAHDETPETLANKIHQLEHLHYPDTINKLMQMQNHS
jgi:phosphoribosylglycinamide formyltransferase-1